MHQALSQLRILIVEDEFYLADDLAAALRNEGAEVVGPVGTLEEAGDMLARGRPDCAILDINLHGEMAFPLADRLQAEGVPILVASGYTSGALPERFQGLPRVEKPFDPRQVIAAIPAAFSPRG